MTKAKPKPLNIASGRLYSLVGKSRSGKTQKALQLIKAIKSVMIWDVEEQYEVDYRAFNLRELSSLMVKHFGKPVHIGYTGNLEDFDGFCERAFLYVRKHGYAGIKTGVVFEETADVTSPSYAPQHYGMILRRGLKYGCDLFAITQRLAESDKTSIGNASIVHICALKLPVDRKYVANATGVPLSIVQGLRADQDNGAFDYITIDDNKAAYRAGQLTFPRGKPVFKDQGSWVDI